MLDASSLSAVKAETHHLQKAGRLVLNHGTDKIPLFSCLRLFDRQKKTDDQANMSLLSPVILLDWL